MGRKEGVRCPFCRQLGPRLAQCGLGRGLLPYQVAFWSIQPFRHNRHAPKIGGLRPILGGGGARFPSNTMWPGPRPTCMPSFILIHSTVWPQYTNVTGRTDREQSDSIRRTVLQTVAQKWSYNMHEFRRFAGKTELSMLHFGSECRPELEVGWVHPRVELGWVEFQKATHVQLWCRPDVTVGMSKGRTSGSPHSRSHRPL